MTFFNSEKRIFSLLFFIYLLSQTFFLFNYDGIYWDDWTLYNNNYLAIHTQFSQNSGIIGIIFTEMHSILLNISNGIISYRVVTFLLLYASAFFIYNILKTISQISKEDRFFLTLFVLISPLYGAKIALINFPYTFFYTIFLFAFYLLAQNIHTMKFVYKVIILTLFFISFMTNSLLIFYGIVLLYIYYKNYYTDSKKNIFLFMKENIIFIFLPALYYFFKQIYCVPSGGYQGYNSITVSNLLMEPINFILVFYTSFLEPINISLHDFLSDFWLLIITLMLIVSKYMKSNEAEYNKSDYILFIFGFLLLFLGAFAYLAVGKIPSLDVWDSRHQLLLSLGFSFILYFSVKLFSSILNLKPLVTLFINLTLVSSFMLFQINIYMTYNIDWMYQKSIIENFKDNQVIKENSTFIYTINLENNLANERTFRFYELNGLSEIAFKNSAKLFVPSQEKLNSIKNHSKNTLYNFNQWNEEMPIYIKINSSGANKFHDGFKSRIEYFWRLKVLQILNEKLFYEEIVKLTKISYMQEE